MAEQAQAIHNEEANVGSPQPFSSAAICPVCGFTEPTAIRTWKAEDIRGALARQYVMPPPTGAVAVDYTELRCPRCTVVFFDPPEPGNRAFYTWISSTAGYFPADRWEWGVVLGQVATGGKGLILEVGCGSGSFLERARGMPNMRAVGLDITPAAVDRCKARGLEAYVAPLESFTETLEGTVGKPDAVVAFHCLEHVPDPYGFVRSMLDVARPGGRVFVSTPYSPMYHERAVFDPANHPPHHLTRWNASAYQALADRVGVHVRLYMPEAPTALRRAWASVFQHARSQGGPVTTLTKIVHALTHPRFVAEELRYQRNRETHRGRVAGEVVLAEFAS